VGVASLSVATGGSVIWPSYILGVSHGVAHHARHIPHRDSWWLRSWGSRIRGACRPKPLMSCANNKSTKGNGTVRAEALCRESLSANPHGARRVIGLLCLFPCCSRTLSDENDSTWRSLDFRKLQEALASAGAKPGGAPMSLVLGPRVGRSAVSLGWMCRGKGASRFDAKAPAPDTSASQLDWLTAFFSS